MSEISKKFEIWFDANKINIVKSVEIEFVAVQIEGETIRVLRYHGGE